MVIVYMVMNNAMLAKRELNSWRVGRATMNLILTIGDTATFGVRLVRHHLFHPASDFLREWGDGEVFLRCQGCGLRSHGLQVGRRRLTTPLAGHSAQRRLESA
jgi:hypothetical protein